jgi:hypothetical protein
MCCLNVCWVQFLVLLPLYLVDVLSELVLGPVPGFILIIFGGYGPVPCLTPVLFGGCVF